MDKILKNEQMFESVNSEITRATAKLAPGDLPEDFTLDLYCECANKACLDRIKISCGDYQTAKHQNGPMFVVLPKHYLPEFEDLIHKTSDYWIIAKRLDMLGKPFEV